MFGGVLGHWGSMHGRRGRGGVVCQRGTHALPRHWPPGPLCRQCTKHTAPFKQYLTPKTFNQAELNQKQNAEWLKAAGIIEMVWNGWPQLIAP
jgi:hypothetical protein